MKLDENFDDQLKKQLGEQKFVPSENSWDKMEHLIVKDEKKRKKRFIIFFYILPGIFVLIASYFILSQLNLPGNSTSISSKEIKGQEENTVSTKSNSTLVRENKITESVPKTKPSEQNSIPTKINSHETGAKIEGKTIKKDKNQIVQKIVSDSAYAFQQNAKFRSNLVLLKKNNLEAVTEEENNDFIVMHLINYDKAFFKGEYLLQEGTPIMAIQSTKSDSAPIAVKKELKEKYYFSLGLGLSGNTTLGSSSNSISLNPYAELVTGKTFGKHFFSEVNLNYVSLGNQTQSPLAFVNTNYEFGYTAETTEIDIRKLHYLGGRIGIGFEQKRWTLTAGVKYSHLFSTSGMKKTYTESYGTKSNYLEKKVYGYSGGIAANDIQVDLGVAFKISSTLKISCFVNYGMSDLKSNSYYNNELFDRNKSLRLQLNYKFLSLKR